MRKLLLISLVIASIFVSNLFAAEQKAPASNVVTSTVTKGILAETSPFVGTIKFTDISSVAAETSGKVNAVKFDAGEMVSKGSVLAVIDSEILEKSIAEAEAGLQQIEARLQLAENDFKRTEKLFSSNATSEQSFDNKKYTAIALEKEKSAQYAALANLKAQQSKKVIYAPYDGIVVSKKISVGEWVSPGSVAAEIAKTGEMDIIVNVPEKLIKYLNKSVIANVETSAKEVSAKFHSIIPTGDVSNRTFPVKLRTSQTSGLLEGMEAKVNLPAAQASEVLFVNRDAIVKAQGNVIVFTIMDNLAKPIPVRIVGYKGKSAGVLSEHLKAGMPVIIKGNERLRPNQPVNVIGG